MSTKDLLKFGLAFALLAVLVLATGCASNDSGSPDEEVDRGDGNTALLSAEDNGTLVELSSGQVLEVKLESNPTTGYSWEVSEVDGTVLIQMGETEFQEAPKEGEQLVGVGGTETFRFASAPGETTLTLVYHRPWEKDVEPLDTFSVEVTVR